MRNLIAILALCALSAGATDLPVIPGAAESVGTFNRRWITQLVIVDGARCIVTTAPYDGTHTLAGVDTRTATLVADDADLQVLIPFALATAKRLADNAALPFVLTVNAPTPQAKIQTVALFRSADPRTPTVFQIQDTLASADAGVQLMAGGLVAWVAVKAGSQDAAAPLAAVKAAITGSP